MITRGLIFIYDCYNRTKKALRSFYYFGRFDILVHGEIHVGNRRNINIGEGCSVNRGVVIQGFNDVTIGKRVVLSINCLLLDGNLDHDQLLITERRTHVPGFVHIGDLTWIGAGAIILPNVEIGSRCVVAAGSVVKDSFPDDSLIAGNPATLIKRLR